MIIILVQYKIIIDHSLIDLIQDHKIKIILERINIRVEIMIENMIEEGIVIQI
jgi:hypothetical protein